MILCNFALIHLGQHCTGQNSIQCCLTGFRQHGIRKNLVQFCLNTLETTLHRPWPYPLISERFQSTMRKKKSCEKFSYYSWDKISQLKILWNVSQKAPDNFVWEKPLCNAALIILGQDSAGQNPVQFCPRGSI